LQIQQLRQPKGDVLLRRWCPDTALLVLTKVDTPFLEMVDLIRLSSTHERGHRLVENDSHKTDGVLGAKIVPQKTYGFLGRTRTSEIGRLLILRKKQGEADDLMTRETNCRRRR